MGNNNVIAVILVVFAYFIGSIPVGVILGKLKGIDPRKSGSGNIGATNVMRAGGKKLGVITLLCDAAKGFIPVMAAMMMGLPDSIVAIAGLMVFLGHVFPVFLKFKGGKGVATALGVYLAVGPWVILGAFVLFVIVFVVWRYVSLASLVGAISVPVGLYFVGAPYEFVVMAGVIAVIVIVRHRENISRLVKGTENKLSFSKPG
ncbi:MAG: glycerol-3-phosphate 1-O-acyltransferase PlsY [Syntrophorhabdaceae bacterium]